MLEVTLSADKKRVVVLVVCDLCAEPLNKEHGGIAMWRLEEEGPSGRIFFLHSGEKRCTRRYEALFPGNWAWATLDFVFKRGGMALRAKGGA